MKWFRKLRLVRKQLDLTLRDVSHLSGLSNPLISQIENGKIKNPSVFTVISLLKAYELDFYDVFGVNQ